MMPTRYLSTSFKGLYAALLILTIEPLLLAINALPKSLLIPTETRFLRWFGYITPAKLTLTETTCPELWALNLLTSVAVA